MQPLCRRGGAPYHEESRERCLHLIHCLIYAKDFQKTSCRNSLPARGAVDEQFRDIKRFSLNLRERRHKTEGGASFHTVEQEVRECPEVLKPSVALSRRISITKLAYNSGKHTMSSDPSIPSGSYKTRMPSEMTLRVPGSTGPVPAHLRSVMPNSTSTPWA
jgi:hypothetical protein